MKRTGDDREDSDADQDFLDRVLDMLYDFGDGVKGKPSKKKHKKKKRGDEEEEEEEEVLAKEDEASKAENSGLNDKADLSHMTGTNHERIPASTSSDATSRCSASDIEIVTFQDPLKKNKLKRTTEHEAKAPEVEEKKKKDLDDVLSIEKARLEVHRFGITGFQKQQQRVFEQDRAIMLGARPPKKDCVNYKVYQQMMKEKRMKEKAEQADTQDKRRKPGKSRKSGKQKTEKPKSGSSGAEASGQVGRFKNGMLVLSNKELQKLKVKVRK